MKEKQVPIYSTVRPVHFVCCPEEFGSAWGNVGGPGAKYLGFDTERTGDVRLVQLTAPYGTILVHFPEKEGEKVTYSE